MKIGIIGSGQMGASYLIEASDLVIIATHEESHAPYAMAVMSAGSHVPVEKPVC